MSTTGNTTVIGGGASDIGSNYDDGFVSKKSPIAETAGIGASPKRVRIPLMTQDANNVALERPFFVTIGKDGVLPALQKLDEQLSKVSRISLLRSFWHMF